MGGGGSVTGAVGYVVRSFPRWSQAFVLEEVLGLEAHGLRVSLFPIVDPREPLVDERVADVRGPVRHLGTRWSPRAHLAVARSRPGRYLRTVAEVIRWADEDTGYRSQSRFRSFDQAVRLTLLLDDEPVDRLHAAFAHDPALVAVLASRLTGVPFSLTAHARDLYQLPAARLVRRAEAAEAIVTCCDANRRHLAAALPPALLGKVHLVVHGVDVDRFRPSLDRVPGDPPVILSVGRLVGKKGFPDLLAAAAVLRRQGRRFRLHIHGEGPDRAALAAALTGAGLQDSVRLLPAVSREALVAAYQGADVFALTPLVTGDGDRDGIPNVLVEAMGCGLPAVSTAVGGVPELVAHGENGLLAPPRDVDAIAAHLSELLDHPAERARLGGAARATVVGRFDAREAAATLAGLLDERELIPVGNEATA
jgi:glycosyltransferase involved in cell wall biosynthesis